MSNTNNGNLHIDLFTSLISDIKTYNGTDPLLPWLRGIRKIKDTLSPQLLNEKLPRFLQKCAQTFVSDRRYANDLRYLRIWLQLMDFVDYPKALLSTMEEKCIGIKKSLFYQAYALYYEKIKKFEKADMMYHLGVQNLAEPLDELKKSYEQFLQRMEKNKKKKIQRQQKIPGKEILRIKSLPTKSDDTKRKNENHILEKKVQNGILVRESNPSTSNSSRKKIVRGDDDTVVTKFVDTAVVGNSEAEDAFHHGLVEPTINTKEALNAINNMFREPLDPTHLNKRSNRSQSKTKMDPRIEKGFEVFIDENLNNMSNQNREKGIEMPFQESFQIYVDEESNDLGRTKPFVFPSPKDLPECSVDVGRSSRGREREDTVVRRFVGATILDEPNVENVCHHGLVEPTINLKEAMDDINSMFGKPIDFVRTTRRKRQEKILNSKNQSNGFAIFADNELDHKQGTLKTRSISKSESDLFEPTVCTKEAFDDINKMFAMPLDF